MGWFWGSSNDDGKSQDPLRDLDPGLREFLAKESPVKYGPPNPTAQASPNAQKEAANVPGNVRGTHVEPEGADGASKIPSKSLYQDGRYAHLWKTYQSQSEVENQNKSDQEKINDVLEGYKYRKAEIGRAALENCALEQWDVSECFRSGDWSSRLTMCRAENRKLERCYLMQAVGSSWFY